MRTENVVSVMCNGRWIMKDKKIVNVNEVLHLDFSLLNMINVALFRVYVALIDLTCATRNLGGQEDVILMAKKACKELVERAGIRIPNRMNFI